MATSHRCQRHPIWQHHIAVSGTLYGNITSLSAAPCMAISQRCQRHPVWQLCQRQPCMATSPQSVATLHGNMATLSAATFHGNMTTLSAATLHGNIAAQSAATLNGNIAEQSVASNLSPGGRTTNTVQIKLRK